MIVMRALVTLTMLLATAAADARGIVVLNYHRVISPAVSTFEPGATVITSDVFNEQMKWLKDNHYTTITASQLAEYMNEPSSFPFGAEDRIVVITFDDGWIDQYDNAFPTLEKYGLVATFNIVASLPDSNDSRYMTWDQVRVLKQAGHEIGSHMEFHLDHPTPEQAYSGIARSKRIIEEQLGKTISTIAWPHGTFNQDMIRRAKEVGFTNAQTIDQNWCELVQVAQDGLLSCQYRTGNAAYQTPFLMKRVFVSGKCSISQFAEVVVKGHTDGCVTAGADK